MPSTPIQTMMKKLLDAAKEVDEKYQRELNHVQDNHPLVTLTPFHRRTEWLEKFKNKDMDKLVGITKKPDKEEYLLSQAWMRTKPLITKCFDGVKDLHRRNWHAIPFWLASAQPLQQESIPFRRYFQSDVVEKYAEIWQRYIIFCLLVYGSD